MIEKIISGGNPGVERAALDAATKYNIPHTGWIHHLRAEERDELTARYHLSIIPALDPKAAIKDLRTAYDTQLAALVGARKLGVRKARKRLEVLAENGLDLLRRR